MVYELKQLSIDNGISEYNILQEIDSNEFGFTNEVKGMSYDDYCKWLIIQNDYSNAINLPENFIAQTTYFFYVDGEPVGIARIRHHSSDYLESKGVGNFGYGIARSFRGKGYGHIFFNEVLKKCREIGYSKIKSFVYVENIASNAVFMKNGAKHIGVFDGMKNIYETTISEG